MANLEKDRRHADLMAGFFSQLGVAFVAGGFLQIILIDDLGSASSSVLFMVGLALHGIAHISNVATEWPNDSR